MVKLFLPLYQLSSIFIYLILHELDRIKAASWIRKLRFDRSDPVLRGDYLKLLLFVLQRRKLIGPFATIPDDSPLEPFPDEINVINFNH